MVVDLDGEELVLLIQLLLPRVVEAERAKPTEQGQSLPFQNQLLQKLQEVRAEVIRPSPISQPTLPHPAV
jgi:hypothetical protein